ncbi:DUF2141 domain-containing protein [Chlorobium sp. KB01]|uniref:DUF2141 domain-containing protein n=1 Tax=Chlorobium sp. KB01 TaxID=1917528 RepID=UPI0009772332|nr:DUF2141 domain-containing protein [Chlorobium sp. KB01]
MTKFFMLFFLLTTLSMSAFAGESAVDAALPAGSIKARFSKIRNTKGELIVSLFNKKEGFPVKSAKAFAKKSLQANDPNGEVVFENVPYGSYALSVFHDENSNGKVDSVFLISIPKEGVGCSNNPKSRFGPPSFNDAKFTLDSREVILNIDLKYL